MVRYVRNSDPGPVPGADPRYASSARSATARSAMALRPGRAGRGTGRWGWWGLAFVVGFIASIVAGNAFTVGPSLYLPGASAAQLQDFYGANTTAVAVQSVMQLVAAVALLLFGYGLRAVVRPAAGNRALALGGTAVAAGGLAASVVCSLVLIPLARSGSDAALAGLGRAALVLGGAVHLLGAGVLMVVASVAALRAGASSRWVFRYGRVAGVLVCLSALSVVIPPLVRLEPAVRLLVAVWIVGVAVAVLRGRVVVHRRTGATHTADGSDASASASPDGDDRRRPPARL